MKLHHLKQRSRINSTVSKPPISRLPSSTNYNSVSLFKGLSRQNTLLSAPVDNNIELEAPFTTKDLGRSLTRKTSKIIREGKAVMTENGKKVAPMLSQYFDYINQFPEKMEDKSKRNEEEKIRKKILNSLPPALKKPSNWIKKRPSQGYLTDKHTYSTMKKIASLPTRKLFIFDDYTEKQQDQES